jgi:pimeloyl-ACP methyl ester carboxylesterase
MQTLAPSRCEQRGDQRPGLQRPPLGAGRCATAADAARLDGFIGQLPVHRRCAPSIPWHVLAPDWRGYGQSEWLNRRYWFADYYADLDALLDRYSPGVPARIVGHSMGGAVASIYGGARPDRIAGLLMVDFLGLPAKRSARSARPHPRMAGPHARDAANACLRQPRAARCTIAAVQRPPAPRARHVSGDCTALANCPTASLLSLATPGTRFRRLTSTAIEEVMACWRAMTAPVRLVTADEGYVMQRFEQASRRTATADGLLRQRQHRSHQTTAGTTCSTIGRKSWPS